MPQPRRAGPSQARLSRPQQCAEGESHLRQQEAVLPLQPGLGCACCPEARAGPRFAPKVPRSALPPRGNRLEHRRQGASRELPAQRLDLLPEWLPDEASVDRPGPFPDPGWAGRTQLHRSKRFTGGRGAAWAEPLAGQSVSPAVLRQARGQHCPGQGPTIRFLPPFTAQRGGRPRSGLPRAAWHACQGRPGGCGASSPQTLHLTRQSP